MNRFRGAVVFLAVFVLFGVVCCKKEESTETTQSADTSSMATQQATASSAAAPAVTPTRPKCAEKKGKDDVDCLESEKTCKVDVVLDAAGKIKVPPKIWVYDGQTIQWETRQPTLKISQIHFAKDLVAAPHKSKKGEKKKNGKDEPLDAAACASDHCLKTVNDAVDCVGYSYTVIYSKGGNNIELNEDPEIEVGSSNGGFLPPPDTSGTTTQAMQKKP
jgi:hypothetical protein